MIFTIAGTLSKAIQMAAPENYKCVIYVDGINIKKAVELTNALRLQGIKTAFVRSIRDESEPLIRLADRWVGCIRSALEGNLYSKKLMVKAINKNYLRLV